MRVRLATSEDLPAIVDIYNASIPGRQATADVEPVAAESRVAWFNQHTAHARPIWVAEIDGRLAGWLSLQDFYGRPAYHRTAEVSVYVAPPFQRQGVARSLVAQALAAAPALGIATMIGFVFGHNLPSLRLFEAFGFQRWGLLPAVAELDGAERDVVILGRRLEGA